MRKEEGLALEDTLLLEDIEGIAGQASSDESTELRNGPTFCSVIMELVINPIYKPSAQMVHENDAVWR